MSDPITLKEARRLICELTKPVRVEEISVESALHRIAAESLKAALPIPSFSHSTRDGYAIYSRDLRSATKSSPVKLPLHGEIPAGCLEIPRLKSGQALHIMTGAAIPPGCDAVIASEEAPLVENGIVIAFPPEKGRHIRGKGSTLARGGVIVRTGQELKAEHLSLLTTSGSQAVRVYAKPTVRLICTGTELTDQGGSLSRGQVISSNRILLDSLIKDNYGVVKGNSTIDDKMGKIVAGLKAALKDQVQFVITTGGMGPGKFDLMARAFAELGIKPIYRSLLVRPGRATMLGISGTTIIFALPGPPPAVRLLFNELVRPALRKTAGKRNPLDHELNADLTEDILIRNGKFTHLKGGLYSARKGRLVVRPATKTEPINCVILLPARRKEFRKGTRMAIHPIS